MKNSYISTRLNKPHRQQCCLCTGANTTEQNKPYYDRQNDWSCNSEGDELTTGKTTQCENNAC